LELHVFGGFHDNPLHRERLSKWLEWLRDNINSPKFIAVEANRTLFQAVIKNQRSKFVNLAKSDPWLGRLPKKSLKELSCAIAFEADTHEQIFSGELKVVWLDDEREDLGMVIDPCSTAEKYLNLCQKALAASSARACDLKRLTPVVAAINEYITRDLNNDIQAVRRAYLSPGQEAGTFHRDDLWVNVLKQTLDNYSSGFGIILVGEDHTRKDGQYLVKQLEEMGYICRVHLLRNEEAPTSG
jgi:hypothetical protein